METISALLAFCEGNALVTSVKHSPQKLLFTKILTSLFNLSPPSAMYMHQSVSWVSIGSDNGLSPIQRQAIILASAVLMTIGPIGINFNEILIKIPNFSFTKMHVNILCAKWLPFCPGRDELIQLEKCLTVSHYLALWRCEFKNLNLRLRYLAIIAYGLQWSMVWVGCLQCIDFVELVFLEQFDYLDQKWCNFLINWINLTKWCKMIPNEPLPQSNRGPVEFVTVVNSLSLLTWCMDRT